MAVVAILPILLVTAVIGTKCDKARGFQKQNDHYGQSQFGELLRPPPPPLSKIFPMPFHGGNRMQRQNIDLGYQYPPPPPPPPSQLQSNSFKFPAPFYKQYNFNFVPSPQPFTTTPSPTVFQKVSNWLFPSTHLGYDAAAQPITDGQGKKECNPCNLVPWIPVIRYDLAAKNLQQNLSPTYGAPSPTAVSDVISFTPQPFLQSSQQQVKPHQTYGVPHTVYGPPQTQTAVPFVATPSSTYGPPSPTHTIAVPSPNPLSSTYGVPSSSIGIPSSSYGVPGYTYHPPSSSYGVPNSNYASSGYNYGAPSSSYRLPSTTYGVPSSTYGPPSSTYGYPAASYGPPRTTNSPFIPVTQTNYQPPFESDVEDFRNTAPSAISNELELPKLSNPTGFRNSYGEPISSNLFGLPFPVSAAAESTKVKTEVLPGDFNQHNGTIALGNPKPFTLNKGRNIHTLQPVALPNLSVSPLPPIFNARPFRTSSILNYFGNTNNNLKDTKQYEITKSVPVTEFSHTVEHPITKVTPQAFDFHLSKILNQNKTYRNILNSFVIDQQKDISSQASEDHIAATQTKQEINDNSFETTGPDFDEDIYNIPNILRNRHNTVSNNKASFADLSEASQADVDNYRTESNLQSIDSPLLYLKPSAPHKEFDNFLIELSTISNTPDYELYDDSLTTASPQISSPTHIWDDQDNNSKEGIQHSPTAQGDSNKPKVVQIVIPYTTGQQIAPNHQYFDKVPNEWGTSSSEEYQGRKVHTNTESSISDHDDHNTEYTTTEYSTQNPADINDSENENMNTPSILNDLYDVRGPPFDIIKLQNNIDDWTEQQFSQQQQRTTPKPRVTPKFAHAKQIPDEYFTTIGSGSSYVTTSTYDYYDDHESAASDMRQSVTENKTISIKPIKEYNLLYKKKEYETKFNNRNNIVDDVQKPHIYTAASSFRSSTTPTTSAPWGKIETSISPLTKEKVYVVTSKPWRDNANVTEWFRDDSLKSASASGTDNLPFKSPRFLNRPSFAHFEGPEIMKSDASYGISRSWHQMINDLETFRRNYLNNSTQVIPTKDKTDSLETTTTETSSAVSKT